MSRLLHSKEMVKIVLQNVLNNYIRSINFNHNDFTTNIGLLNTQYQKEVKVKNEFSLNFNGANNKFLLLNQSLKFVRENIFQKNISALFEAKIFLQIKNSKKSLYFCNLFLLQHPLTQEVLIEKSQNEILVGELNDALVSIDLWNKSNVSIYSLFDREINFNTPLLVFSPTTKYAIYLFKGKYYLVPLSKKYYGVKTILGNMVMVPNGKLYLQFVWLWKILKRSYILRIAYSLSKRLLNFIHSFTMYLFRFTLRFLLRPFFGKNTFQGNNGDISNNYLYSHLIIPLIKKSIVLFRFLLQHFFKLYFLKPYVSLNDALMDAKQLR